MFSNKEFKTFTPLGPVILGAEPVMFSPQIIPAKDSWK